MPLREALGHRPAPPAVVGLLQEVALDHRAHRAVEHEHAHRRLGFSDREVASWFRAVGLAPDTPRVVPGQPLDVVVWLAARTPSLVSDARPTLLTLES